jgi:hypothetical protein
MKIQSKMRVRPGSRIHKYESVPDVLIKVSLVVPPGCDIRDMEWHDKFPSVRMPWRFQFQGLITDGPTFEQERNAEAARVLALPDAEFKQWLIEQKERGAA